MEHTYPEPAGLWQLRHPDGRKAHAVIVPRGFDTCAAVIIDDTPEEAKDFTEWEDAFKWLAEIRRSREGDGWRQID